MKMSHGIEWVTYELKMCRWRRQSFCGTRARVSAGDCHWKKRKTAAEKQWFRCLEIRHDGDCGACERELWRAVKQVAWAMLKTMPDGLRRGKDSGLMRTDGECEGTGGNGPVFRLILKKFVPVHARASIFGVRGRDGEIAFYP